MGLKKSDFERALDGISPSIDRFPFENRTAYAWWLSQTYYFVNHSTRLLALAASKMEPANPLHHRFLQHAAEERAHEQIATHDLKKLGFELGDFYELSPTRFFYQSQYYLLNYSNVNDFFGYILALEMMAVRFGEQILGRVKKGVGSEGTRFLSVHTNEDPDHVDKAIELVDRLDDAQGRVLWRNFQSSLWCYRQILHEADVAAAEFPIAA